MAPREDTMAKRRQKQKKYKKAVKRKSRKEVEARVRKAMQDWDRIPWPNRPTIAQVTEDGMGMGSVTDFTAYLSLSEWAERIKTVSHLKTEDDGTFLTECKVPVRLTSSQVAVVENCCIPPDEYAKNMILREREELKNLQRKKEFEEQRPRALPPV